MPEDTADLSRLEKLGKHGDFHQQIGKSESLGGGSEMAQALPLAGRGFATEQCWRKWESWESGRPLECIPESLGPPFQAVPCSLGIVCVLFQAHMGCSKLLKSTG